MLDVYRQTQVTFNPHTLESVSEVVLGYFTADKSEPVDDYIEMSDDSDGNYVILVNHLEYPSRKGRAPFGYRSMPSNVTHIYPL